MPTTDAVQLHHVRLEKCNSKWEVYAHYPELRAAWKVSIGGVGEENLDEVKMEKSRRDDGEKDVAHPQEVQVAMEYQPRHASIQNDRPHNGDGDIGLSNGVKVEDRAPITSLGTDVNHFGDVAVLQLPQKRSCLAGGISAIVGGRQVVSR